MEELSTPEMLSLRAGASSVTVTSSGNHAAIAVAVSGNTGGPAGHPGICHILQLVEGKAGIHSIKDIFAAHRSRSTI